MNGSPAVVVDCVNAYTTARNIRSEGQSSVGAEHEQVVDQRGEMKKHSLLQQDFTAFDVVVESANVQRSFSFVVSVERRIIHHTQAWPRSQSCLTLPLVPALNVASDADLPEQPLVLA